jgi:hypothetical protein
MKGSVSVKARVGRVSLRRRGNGGETEETREEFDFTKTADSRLQLLPSGFSSQLSQRSRPLHPPLRTGSWRPRDPFTGPKLTHHAVPSVFLVVASLYF